MIFCTECGKENVNDSKYCSECGNELIEHTHQKNGDTNPNLTICKDCKSTVSKNADKCPHCGANLKKSSVDHFTSLIVAILFFVGIFIFFVSLKT